MIVRRWNTPVGEATYSIHPFCVVLDYPNEAGMIIIWGLARLDKWRWLWNEAV